MKYLLSILTFSLISTLAIAQATKQAPKSTSKSAAKESAAEKKGNPRADSLKFEAAFKELFPLIRPTQTIKERGQTNLARMSRMFKAQGIDSAKAYDSALAALNPNEDEKILSDAFRGTFSAEEIKSLVAFFKSPTGKHYLEVEPRIMGARNSMIEQYVQRTINQVIMPMRKPMEHRPGQMPPGGPGMRGRPGQPGMNPGGPGGRPGMPPELPPGVPPPPVPPVPPMPDSARH